MTPTILTGTLGAAVYTAVIWSIARATGRIGWIRRVDYPRIAEHRRLGEPAHRLTTENADVWRMVSGRDTDVVRLTAENDAMRAKLEVIAKMETPRAAWTAKRMAKIARAA